MGSRDRIRTRVDATDHWVGPEMVGGRPPKPPNFSMNFGRFRRIPPGCGLGRPPSESGSSAPIREVHTQIRTLSVTASGKILLVHNGQ